MSRPIDIDRCAILRAFLELEPLRIPRGTTAHRRVKSWRRARRKVYAIEADAIRMARACAVHDFSVAT